MKILCLHGRGTNGEVFEVQSEQTEAFRSLLPEHYSYTFPDAENDCTAAPGVQQLAPGPYLCWYADDSVKSLAEQFEVVSDIIAEEGPFDVVIGFSQVKITSFNYTCNRPLLTKGLKGAALAASIILHHQTVNPLSPPFRAAIFFSSFRPFSPDPSIGTDITNEPGVFTPAVADGPLDKCQWFDPANIRTRMHIPTAHIYGAKDEFQNQALDTIGLSDQSLAKVLVHDAGHEIPMQLDVCQKIRDVIVATVDRSTTFQ